jgi:DNA-binding transcriptional MocR family regulator
VIKMTAVGESFRVDDYVVDVLMRDLAGHDRSPAAFLVYLFLWRRSRGEQPSQTVKLSHRNIAEETGLSKSAVQQALRILHRRGLVKSRQRHATDTPSHHVVRTWAREKSPSQREERS